MKRYVNSTYSTLELSNNHELITTTPSHTVILKVSPHTVINILKPTYALRPDRQASLMLILGMNRTLNHHANHTILHNRNEVEILISLRAMSIPVYL